jgi:GTP-binding protein HflX
MTESLSTAHSNEGFSEPDRDVDRVLATELTRAATVSRFGERRAEALHDDETSTADLDGEQFDREERAALRRVPGLSTSTMSPKSSIGSCVSRTWC